MKLMIFGCGYSASRFVELHGGGFARITGTSRDPRKLAGLARPSFSAEPFDGTGLSDALRANLREASHLLISIPPDQGGDQVLKQIADAEAPALRWIGYLSTVGVYGDAQGAWVDEGALLKPAGPRNLLRVEAERDWGVFAERRQAALQIFRIAGIYGRGRNALHTIRQGTARRIVKPGQVFNRIHVDDIAGAIAAGIVRPSLTGPVNLADDEPAPPQDVVAYAAQLMGVAPPPEVPFEEADMTPMARSFYGSNKRVSNRRLRERFGYALAYPTYREGLQALLAQEG